MTTSRYKTTERPATEPVPIATTRSPGVTEQTKLVVAAAEGAATDAVGLTDRRLYVASNAANNVSRESKSPTRIVASLEIDAATVVFPEVALPAAVPPTGEATCGTGTGVAAAAAGDAVPGA